MYLHEIPEKSKMIINLSRDDGEPEDKECTFGHIDGMYSYCTVDDDNSVFHLSAMTPMKEVGDHYEIDNS